MQFLHVTFVKFSPTINLSFLRWGGGGALGASDGGAVAPASPTLCHHCVAMGSKLGPSYAWLFVSHPEQVIYESYNGPFPCLIKRYIDDIVGATSLLLADLQQFINYTNNFTQPCSSRTLLQKKACPFWTSSLLSLATKSPHPSTTNLQMPIASLTTIHRILRNAKTPPYPCLNSAVSVVFGQMMKI